MSQARDVILGRIRTALADVADAEPSEDLAVPRDYRRRDGTRGRDVLAECFLERVDDYGATAIRCQPGEIAARVTQVCSDRGLSSVRVAPGIPRQWWPEGDAVEADGGGGIQGLEPVDVALTGCAVAIADTGTVVLDGRDRCGRRALTLLPDHHICVVELDQLVAIVPEAIALLVDAQLATGPITFISGPSASSDIELARVEGVHGPRNLVVMLAG